MAEPFLPDAIGREIVSRALWLEWRRSDITASRVAALFDAHPYLTRAQLAGQLASGEGQGDNAAMRAGRILEPGVAVAVGEERPEWRIVKATTYHCIPSLRLGATPDYWINDDGLLQCKTASPETWEKWHGQPPLMYFLQTLTEMMVTGRTRGCLAIMIRSRSYPLHLFDVARHEGAELRIIDAVREWWRSYDAGEIAVPAPSAGLAAVFDDGSTADLSADNMLPELLAEHEALKETASDAEARLDQINETIREKVGAARMGWLPGWVIKLPTIHAKAYTVAARDYRRLTVTKTEKAE